MINVDGVVYGNFRCDLAGYDINRCWKKTNKIVHPQLYAIKEKIKEIKDNGKIYMMLDFHTHSK